MAKSNLRDSPSPSHDRLMIDSALHTLEVEAGGVAAVRDGLGSAFIRGAESRVIVTGMGKSEHPDISFFVYPGEASHDDLGMVELAVVCV